MFAKSPNREPDDVTRSSNPRVAESHPGIAREEAAQIRNDQTSDKAKLLIFPSQSAKAQPTWADYEELFPSTYAEATEPLNVLSSVLINRRCYYHQYWPENTVFRIKDIDAENNTVYLNLIYRWVSATQVRLIKNLMPQRPPKGLELDYLIDDDCSDF